MLRAAASVLLALVLTGAGATAQPNLRLVKAHPVAIHGSGFQPDERVRIVVRGASGVSRGRATADAAGGFSKTFRNAVIARCAGFEISATGSAGSRARLFRRVPECTPARVGAPAG
jgi:hypothetical protein